MDRNSAIGFTLIVLLLLAYFYWFSPEPKPATPTTTSSQLNSAKRADSTRQQPEASDSLRALQFGSLAKSAEGQEVVTSIETADLRVKFNNKGGIIEELELKNFKTYGQERLMLISPKRSTFSLLSRYQAKEIDLYKLFYSTEQNKKGDTTEVIFTLALPDGSAFKQIYSIPAQGYEIGYKLIAGNDITSDNLTFRWSDRIPLVEKDLQDTRTHTTITYYSDADGFDNLAERSSSTESDNITRPVKWVAIKQKFFLTSIIASSNFSGAELTSSVNPSDSSVVKQADIRLTIPKNSFVNNTAAFKLYLGPNNYNIIGQVTEGFAKNVYLGWPPVYWINKFVIFPVFHFLTRIISNYGLIIIVLVLLLKLVLAPLSYRSYLSMAKMKVLKPELDEIKEKHGEDMTKVQQEQLKLYQQVGVNPISGCVPVLLQMPILFAMFYLFPASIELRQQPFLWAEDLSTYDSIIRLPFAIPFGVGNHISLFTLLMTASTLIYTWQNNQLSSVQGPMKSMSYIMPIIFFFVLNSFSAGLTFYYFVSNLVTFGQQAVIRKFVDENKIKLILEENRKKNLSGGGGKKSKFMAKLEDAMKASEEARRKAEEERKKRK